MQRDERFRGTTLIWFYKNHSQDRKTILGSISGTPARGYSDQGLRILSLPVTPERVRLKSACLPCINRQLSDRFHQLTVLNQREPLFPVIIANEYNQSSHYYG